MQTILTLREQDINPNASEVADRSGYFRRTAVRALVFDADGKVALMHAAKRGYYKLPGGGVDEGEDLMTALNRELMEELGCKAEVTGELGQVVEYRDYEQMTQTSYCYTAQLIGDKGEPDFTDEERAEGFEVAWHKNIDAAIAAMVSVQPPEGDLGVLFMQRRDKAILQAARVVVTKK